MKPTILMDMDGPLADFDARIHQYAPTYGWEWKCEQPCAAHRFLTDCVDKEAAKHMRAVINHTPWFRSLPVVDGAVEGMELLSEIADVWICTKPLEANRTCRDDKAEWLGKNFGKHWVDRLILAPDKSLVRGDLLVDDAIKPNWLSKASWNPVVFSLPFNGAGSKWEHWPHWTWGDGVARLLRFL